METGVVTSKKGNSVVVKMTRTDACDKCRACSVGMDIKDMIIEAENICSAEVGDTVAIELDQSNFLSAVLIMYTVPLIAFFIGMGIGYSSGKMIGLSWYELLSVLIGFVFVALAYLAIRMNEKKWKSKKYQPKAVRVVE